MTDNLHRQFTLLLYVQRFGPVKDKCFISSSFHDLFAYEDQQIVQISQSLCVLSLPGIVWNQPTVLQNGIPLEFYFLFISVSSKMSNLAQCKLSRLHLLAFDLENMFCLKSFGDRIIESLISCRNTWIFDFHLSFSGFENQKQELEMSLTLLPRMDQASKTLDSHNLVASLVRLHHPPTPPHPRLYTYQLYSAGLLFKNLGCETNVTFKYFPQLN